MFLQQAIEQACCFGGAGFAMHLRGSLHEALFHCAIGEDRVEVAREIVEGPVIAMHLDAMAGFVDAGGVVVAVPNVRHDDRRLAEVQTLGEGVVAAVVNDSVNLRNDRGLREPLVENYILWDVRVSVEICADIHQRADRELTDGINEALQGLGIAAAERAEAHVDHWLVRVPGKRRDAVGLLLADTSFEIFKVCGIQRSTALELYGLGIEQQVEERRCFEELADGIGRFAVLREECVEAIVDGADYFVETIFVGTEALLVLFATAREVRGNLRIGNFVFTAGDDAHPRLAVLLDRGKENHVVDADEVGSHLVENGGEIFLRPDSGIDDSVPTVAHIVVDLVVGRFIEIGNVAVDEVLPVLGDIFGSHGRSHVDDVLGESVAGVNASHVRGGKEDRFMAEGLAGLGDTDGVESRAIRRLWKEGDHFRWTHARFPLSESCVHGDSFAVQVLQVYGFADFTRSYAGASRVAT